MSANLFTVDTNWLFERLDDPEVSIVDASWYLPTMTVNGVPRDGEAEYLAQHIPGAVYFNIESITDPESDLPHTIAPAGLFSRKAGEMGISEKNTIVIYDGMGLFSAPRVWWNFRVMGAKNAVILNGGLPKWIKDGYPLESGMPAIYPRFFTAKFKPKSVISFADMSEVVTKGTAQIVDARPADRFSGQAQEPRPGIRAGHMPGAKSLPFTELARGGELLPADELREKFEQAGIDLQRPVVTTCGSGVTAAAISLALRAVGHDKNKLYDGSWAEWGGSKHTPVVTDDDADTSPKEQETNS